MQESPTTTQKKKYRDLNPEELAAAIEENKKIFDEHFDLPFAQSLTREVIRFLNMYFRPRFIGFEKMPDRSETERPLIFAMNHSGMAFPWDGIVFAAGLMENMDYDLGKVLRPLAAPMLSASTLMNPFLLKDAWKRVGAVDATGLNFETMMHFPDSHLLLYPEGVPGIGKGFNRKYQLQTFSSSMVRMAIKYKTDVISCLCVNGEYINPYSYSIPWVNKLVQKIGVPFLPLSVLTILILVQPWMFYYAWPAKLTYLFGKRYSPADMAGGRSVEDLTREEIRAIRDQLQAGMQEELNEGVKKYGKHPFEMREFFRSLAKNWRELPYWVPPGWPALFSEYDRRYYQDKELPTRITQGWFAFWKIVWRNPIILAYFIPILGWIPLAWRGLKGRRKVKPWEGSKV